MNRLERKHHKPDGANKYHINCNILEKTPSMIPILLDKVIKNKDDITVLESIINDKNITSKQKHIVIKIGKINMRVEHEFMIGKFLEKHNIPGFVKYMCLFKCYDDIYQKIDMNNIKSLSLCDARKEDENMKAILVMPFISEGSIRTFKWNHDKYNVLKSIIQQTILSTFMAYQKYGFIHNDLHLDNILLKKTKKETIDYENRKIKTYGYKIVIMDFESSLINIEYSVCNLSYWQNLLNILSRLNFDIKNNDGDIVHLDNLNDITGFIIQQQNRKSLAVNSIQLLDMIDKAKIKIIEMPKFKAYDPNAF
jgi:serine/threonine protein kinase